MTIRVAWIAGTIVLLAGLWRIDATPWRLMEGFGRLGFLVHLMVPPSDGGMLGYLVSAMRDTIAMAFLGTLLGATIALPLALLGAANVTPIWLLRFGLRRVWDGLRGIDALIWALIFVAAVGMGPFAGVLALAVPDIGTLAKLFSEAIEAADRRQTEAIRGAGGGRLAVVRFGIVPQVLPVLLSQILYFFESNVRSASAIGVVGAGGIGLALSENLRLNNWDRVAFIILMILVVVGAIDAGSQAIRRGLT